MAKADPVRELRKLVQEMGTQKAVAAYLGLSQTFIADLLGGRRKFPDAVLEKLGLRREVVRS